ncbi:MAG: cation:proton antiporter [Bacteroidales bacterium]|nr:cation:proton antiporter [Bacteroidales bacterium]
MGSELIFLGLLVFSAHLFASLFKTKRIPDVLLLMIIGIVIGPVLHWVRPNDLSVVGGLFSSLTLLLILFDSGMDTSIDAIRRHWRGMVEITLLSLVVSVIAATAIASQMGFDIHASLLLGCIVSGTAAAIVIPLVRQMKVSERTATILVMESAVSGMLSIVATLSLLDGYRLGTVTVGGALGNALASLVMSLLIGMVGGIIWAGLLDGVRKLQNSMFLTPAFLVVLYGLAEALGYSGAMASLAFGIVLGNIDYFDFSFLHKFGKVRMRPLSKPERSLFKELVFVFKTFFFVYIGICIPFDNGCALLYGLIITVALFVVRFALVALVGRKNTSNDRLVVSMMIPKGLVAAVLATMPERLNAQMGYEVVPNAAMIKSIAYSVIFCSIVVTSLIVLFTSRKLVKAELPEFKEEVYDYE